MQITGKYIEPTFYTKITSNSGKTVVKSRQPKKQVVSKDVACILQQILTEPVNGSDGTATYCKIPNMDVAAKTGTTNDNYDRWLCGFTPYYTAVSWYGFDLNETIETDLKTNPAGLIWSNVMKKIHQNLPAAKFSISKDVISYNICKESGKIATPNCKDIYLEYFLKDNNVEYCSLH